jgi:hypothetical protein
LTQVDTQLRSDIIALAATFRAPASEPIWSERAEPSRDGAQLVLYITERKAHFGTLGAFWVHALFGFLEDRFESEALVEAATASLCRKATIRELLAALEGRLDRAVDDAERAAMCIADDQAGVRVFLMLASEERVAALIEAGSRLIGAFVAEVETEEPDRP